MYALMWEGLHIIKMLIFSNYDILFLRLMTPLLVYFHQCPSGQWQRHPWSISCYPWL